MTTEATKMGPDGLANEGMPSLAEFADEPGGAWPKGWYKSRVVSGYSTRGGKVYSTENALSKDGSSQNLWICVELTDQAGSKRNLRTNFNYRPEDFTPERLERIREARGQFKGSRGKWEGQADLQRSSISIGQLGQLEKAFGMHLARHPQTKNLLPTPLIDKAVDVQLGLDDNGYNEVIAFAPAGSKVR